MTERILEIIKQLEIKPFTIEKDTNGHISRVAATKIIDGRTKNPRLSTLEILATFLCDNYKVSREWLVEGKGEIFLKDKSDCFLEKHGVRFSMDEVVDHLVENQEMYFDSSEPLRLAFVNNIVKNKDFYMENSEYFKFFIKSLIEEGIETRLSQLRDLGIVIKQKD